LFSIDRVVFSFISVNFMIFYIQSALGELRKVLIELFRFQSTVTIGRRYYVKSSMKGGKTHIFNVDVPSEGEASVSF
jgi:hypothetical protein